MRAKKRIEILEDWSKDLPEFTPPPELKDWEKPIEFTTPDFSGWDKLPPGEDITAKYKNTNK